MVSSREEITGLMVAISVVFVPPPKESWSSLVSLDSLNGTWSWVDFAPLARAEITLPRMVKDRLIFLSSSVWLESCSSSVLIFSEPARSQRLNFD